MLEQKKHKEKPGFYSDIFESDNYNFNPLYTFYIWYLFLFKKL